MKHEFTTEDKQKALAIVRIFETGRPLGRYDAVAVLNDGAGVSYGINQFTHRSGSLAAVVREYLLNARTSGSHIERLRDAMPFLTAASASVINRISADEKFKQALRTAAGTRAMQQAQHTIAERLYLKPALDICRRMGFRQPLSLAVVYDSITHGSWAWVSARVDVPRPAPAGDAEQECAWITEYIRARHRWLSDVRRLRPTSYRTKFFLDQITVGNWELNLPTTVHGFRLTADLLKGEAAASEPIAAAPSTDPPTAPAASLTQRSTEIAAAATRGFDRVEGVVAAVATRADSAKSLWTTVGGAITQAVWGVIGFALGLPRTVWIVVAIICGALALLYLYRQITLGRIRESAAAAQAATTP